MDKKRCKIFVNFGLGIDVWGISRQDTTFVIKVNVVIC
jgi:hypothetical protein